jgi:hypothetical protein
MSPPRLISLAEAVSWFAWDQRFTAEDFLGADRLKVSAGEILLYSQYLKEGKMPAESAKALEMYRRAEADDRKIIKRIKEASGHSYTSKTGRNAAKKDLDAAFAVIVKAIQEGRLVEPVQGQSEIDNERKSIPWKWFDKKPEPTAFHEMNALGHGTKTDIDGNEQPDLQYGWTDVEIDLDKIERLRKENSAWPLNKCSELAVMDEPKPVAAGSPEEEPAKQSNRGRKPTWDWGGAVAHLLSVANTPDGLPEVQADIERLVADWFRQTVDDEPVESAIRKHVSGWCKGVLGEASNSPTSN